MCALCAAARAQSLSFAVQILLIGWLGSVAWYFLVAPTGMTWGYAVFALFQASAFWKQSQKILLARPLFVFKCVALGLHLTLTLAHIGYWWNAFLLNRLFELSLLYLAGCAIYRLRTRRDKEKGALRGARLGHLSFNPA